MVLNVFSSKISIKITYTKGTVLIFKNKFDLLKKICYSLYFKIRVRFIFNKLFLDLPLSVKVLKNNFNSSKKFVKIYCLKQWSSRCTLVNFLKGAQKT